MKIIKKILKYSLIWIIFFVAINVYMFLGTLIPKNLIEKNIIDSSFILLQQGDYREINNFYLDNYTDALMLNQEYSIDSKNPVYSYMASLKNYDPEVTEKIYTDSEYANNLKDFKPAYVNYQVWSLSKMIDGKLDIATEYARYWHGWMPIYRVLLIFFNINEMRLFFLIIFLILLVIFMHLMKKRFGRVISLIFAYSLIVQNYFTTAISISGVPCYLIIMIASIILLIKIDKIKELGLFFFIIGCLTSFFDFLTVPLLTLTIPLFICVLYDKKTENKLNFLQLIKYCLLWGIGYGITWASKWIIYDLIYNKGIIENAIKTTKYRVSNRISYYYIFLILIEILKYAGVGIELLIVKLLLQREKISFENFWKENKLFLFITILHFAWYILVSEHSNQHYSIFVYKLKTGIILGILLIVNNMIKIQNGKDVELKCQSQKK